MSVFTKLATLLRAGVRESAEAVTDANAIRIYRQEIIDAESMLTQRRDALAAMIAARKELEDDIQASQRRIAKREQQLAKLPAEERSEDLLQLAARDIAATESHLEDSKRGHINLCEKIQREEITLRKLLAEIKEHRRGNIDSLTGLSDLDVLVADRHAELLGLLQDAGLHLTRRGALRELRLFHHEVGESRSVHSHRHRLPTDHEDDHGGEQPECATHDLCPVFEVGCEHAMKAGQVKPWTRHQGRQSRDEVQRLQHHMGGAVPERALVAVHHPAQAIDRQALGGKSGDG